MDVKKLAIFGGLGIGAYLLSKKAINIKDKIEDDINSAQNTLDSLIFDAETVLDDLKDPLIPAAEKYIKIIPYADFSDVTGARWIGTFRWDIVNTSKQYTFVLDRIRSNFWMDGNLGAFIPGHKRLALRLEPGQSVEIYCTWQDKKWMENSSARDAVRDILQANMDQWLPILQADIELSILEVGQYKEQIVKWNRVTGSVRLRSGAIMYWSNEGENADQWGNEDWEKFETMAENDGFLWT